VMRPRRPSSASTTCSTRSPRRRTGGRAPAAAAPAHGAAALPEVSRLRTPAFGHVAVRPHVATAHAERPLLLRRERPSVEPNTPAADELRPSCSTSGALILSRTFARPPARRFGSLQLIELLLRDTCGRAAQGVGEKGDETPPSPELRAKARKKRTSAWSSDQPRTAWFPGIACVRPSPTARLKIVVSPVRVRVSPSAKGLQVGGARSHARKAAEHSERAHRPFPVLSAA
jgi:hypothetical protein